MALADILRQLLARGPMSPRRVDLTRQSFAEGRLTRWQRALADLGYPYTLVPHARVEAVLSTEREAGAREGFSPVVIVPGLWNSNSISAEKRARKALQLVTDHGAAFDAAFGREMLAGELEAMLDDREVDPGCPDPAQFDQLQQVQPRAPRLGLQLLRWYNVETRAEEDVTEAAIMRVPTPHNHWIPVYLNWGGWNDVPSDMELGAILQHWHEAYGAQLVAISSDLLEFSVARKPVDHASSVALLKEHYCFAPDSWQVPGFSKASLEQAAADLRVADTWTFWWD